MASSAARIVTTHVGSLPRPVELLDAMREKYNEATYDEAALAAKVKRAVNDVVAKQQELGIDIVSDGEQGKLGFYAYVRERLGGFEPADSVPMEELMGRSREVRAFPEYYQRYFGKRSGPRVGNSSTPVKCVGPISYQGQAALATDIANLKSAMAAAGGTEAFMPAIAPSGVGRNEYYSTEEEYVEALANALREEYQGIIDAGLYLQLDDAWLTSLYGQDGSENDLVAQRKEAEKYVEMVNHALRGLPTERVRFHTCYGINEGPRVYDVPFEAFIDIMLKVDAGAYSFEHPLLVADRICNFAGAVGRENIIAGADCGYSSNASYETDIPLSVVWEKFKSLTEGAAVASQRLWS
jgi:5-methyltetrahydropteroyltriglutamate--homocysteine methyltransferase